MFPKRYLNDLVMSTLSLRLRAGLRSGLRSRRRRQHFFFSLVGWMSRIFLVSVFLLGLIHCGSQKCLPDCPQGYVCVVGQCQIDPKKGKEGLSLCEDYCTRLIGCQEKSSFPTKSKVNICIAQWCKKNYPPERKKFYLRSQECYLAASCQDIQNYLQFQSGFLRTCIGCSIDTDCPGGFRCDLMKKLCLNACQTSAECRTTYECQNNKCIVKAG